MKKNNCLTIKIDKKKNSHKDAAFNWQPNKSMQNSVLFVISQQWICEHEQKCCHK